MIHPIHERLILRALTRAEYRAHQAALRARWADPTEIDRPGEGDPWQDLHIALRHGLSDPLPVMTRAEQREYREDRLLGLRSSPITVDRLRALCLRRRADRPLLP